MSPRRASNIATAALAAALVAFPASLWADPLSDEVQAIFQRCSKAVVKIEAEDDDGQLSGTGFFVDPNGTIYTNYSVGGESHDIIVSDGVARYPASRIAADPRSGLAILKVDGTKTPFLPLGKSSDLQVASMVMAIGYPLDLPVTPNVGCVGGFSISSGDRVFAVSHIRANVAVERGEGGAPLLDMNGQVVGILESSLDGGAGCFALPIEAAEKVYGDVMHFGGVRPGWLGIRFDDSGSDPSKIKVQGFIAGSPAEKSGLQLGDVIVKVGDHPVSTFDDIMNAAFYLTAGEEVPVTVSRAGQPVEIRIVPAANPLAPQQEMVPAAIFSLSVRLSN